jgi:AbrB family looped-hinge helix DNA binding protein
LKTISKQQKEKSMKKISKVNTMGSVVIPKKIRQELGITAGDYMLITKNQNGTLTLAKATFVTEKVAR